MRLLVVEDNAQLSQLLAKGLQTAGYETDRLATAAEARDLIMQPLGGMCEQVPCRDTYLAWPLPADSLPW
jgi:CheY-like chemotaxis protein